MLTRRVLLRNGLGLTLLGLAACSAPAAAPSKPADPAKSSATAGPPKSEQAPPAAKAGQPAAAEQPLSPPVRMKIGGLGSAGDAGFFIGLERGYYQQEGLEIEYQRLDSSEKMIPSLATGDLQVGSGGLAAATFNAINRGVDIRMVAAWATYLPGFGNPGILVRKDLLDSGEIKTIADLKGRTVARGAEENIDSYTLDETFKRHGFRLDDVKSPYVPIPQILAALQNKTVDASWAFEPLLTTAEEQNIARKVVDFVDIVGEFQSAQVLYAPSFIEQQPEAARRFMIAYLKSVRDYNDAFRKGKDKDAIIEIMAKRSTLNSKEIWAKVKAPGIDPNGYVDAKSVETAQEFHAARGWLKSKVDLAKVIDNQFVDHAIARLGRYQA